MKQIKIPKQYFCFVHYYYLYNHKYLPKNYVSKWKKYFKLGYNTFEQYYNFFTKKEWKEKLKELPKDHEYITKWSKNK